MKKILLVPAGHCSDFGISYDTEIRVLSAIECCGKRNFDLIIFSGGIFWKKSKSMPNISAAKFMKNMFERYSPNILSGKNTRIVLENESLDTFQCIDFSLKIIQEQEKIHGKAEITVISDWQHLKRLKISFWKGYGIKIKTRRAFYSVELRQYLKEWMYLLVHMLDPKGTSWLPRINRKCRNFN